MNCRYSMFAALLLGVSGHAWGEPKSQKVRLHTPDGWTLSAAYVAPGKPIESGLAVVLLHGVLSGKEEWEPFQKALFKNGISSLAVDLRGHGGSLQKGKRKYSVREFSDHGPNGEWVRMWMDAQAGVQFLESKGYRRIGLAGASVGANVAAQAAARLPQARFLILLSPGRDYQGIVPTEALQVYGPGRLLLAASEPDAYAYESSQYFRGLRISMRLPADWIEAPSGHGVQMFQDVQVMDKIIAWILQDPNR